MEKKESIDLESNLENEIQWTLPLPITSFFHAIDKREHKLFGPHIPLNCPILQKYELEDQLKELENND